MVYHKTVTLNTGAIMPTVGLGTWKSAPGQVEHAVEYALKEGGYKHIDTAYDYGNEAEVGQGIKASGVPRAEIFLTTKLPNGHHHTPEKALEESLAALDTYIDLWLMHWPAPMKNGKADKSANWIDTWKRMEVIYENNKDKVRAIGVSNIGVKYLRQLLKEAKIVPAVNQVELHPSCSQEALVKECREHGIIVTAYSPLGSDNSPLLKDPVVTTIAAAHGVFPANVLISLQANREGVTVLPKSVTNERIKANMNIIDLTDEEIRELNDIDKTKHFRACRPHWTGWGSLGWEDQE
ncbi:Aldo/keto reductase [Dacryopinax primogenitus]|uniref:Aldo/keto reductase n=1 Tax=Dacryopinax primogenitus (strain DJM 731) TaxID=1858805 RepID=M5G7B3_DACPD|nr:Aldo/keto reductase [Dacryopinax primogenitus]EJU06121.1 Aldo/keto reductase [Dacryopinax primogenitus]